MDPVTGVTAGVGAASGITGIAKTIGEIRTESKLRKLRVFKEEKETHRASDQHLLRLVEEGKCNGIGNVKQFRKLMKEVFRRNPEQGALLGRRLEKCIEIAKRRR